MKPLAAPVLGGMLSSLLHVLIVTPVIFYWLRERRLPADAAVAVSRRSSPEIAPSRRPRRLMMVAAILVVMVGFGVYQWGNWRSGKEGTGNVVQTVTSGDLRISLVSASGSLRQGRNAFDIEFRDTGGKLVDVGIVKATAAMQMPGMAMSGAVQVEPSGVAGRYHATADFGMAGMWSFTIEWAGGGRSGVVAFEGAVQ
jgi:hypothetical protein